MWSVVLVILLALGVIGAVLVGFGVGIGYLLHALVPGLSIDLAMVAGAIFAVGLFHLLPRLFQGIERKAEDLDEDEEFVDEPFVAVPPAWFRHAPSGRRKRRKPGPRRHE